MYGRCVGCVLYVELGVKTRRQLAVTVAVAPSLAVTETSPHLRFKAKDNRLAPERGTSLNSSSLNFLATNLNRPIQTVPLQTLLQNYCEYVGYTENLERSRIRLRSTY